MRILFISAPEEDYLGDSLLHGLRGLYGADVVDFPKNEILYENCPGLIKTQVRGNGFTLYSGLLEDQAVDRFRILEKIRSGWFSLVIFSDIWRTFGYFLQWRPWLNPQNCVILDGQDSPQVYPSAGYWWRRPYYWFLPRIDNGFLYFKREWTGDSRFGLLLRLLPARLRQVASYYRGLRRISFSIPEEKIRDSVPEKRKAFARHVVDAEIAGRIPGSSTRYAFSDEQEYYADLGAPRFAITTRRAGWDCLRHYEIAANGCVPCFRNLDGKPGTCAPHGLVAGENCLSYTGGDDLFRQTGEMTEAAYRKMAAGALQWARSKSTRVVAGELVAEWRRSCGTENVAGEGGGRCRR